MACKRRQIMKLKTWPDVWTFLRSIRQKRSLGNDRFALRSLGQASCPRWGLVASCMFLGVSIYTSLFWLEGDFRAPPFHCQLVQTKHVLGGKKSFDFHFFKRHEYSEIWTVELHHWFAPTRGVLKSFFPNNTLPVRADHVLETFFLHLRVVLHDPSLKAPPTSTTKGELQQLKGVDKS